MTWTKPWHSNAIRRRHFLTENLHVLTRRNPTLFQRLEGWLLLRLAERKFCALLFQLSPRITRLEPAFGHSAKLSDFSKILLLSRVEFTWET